VGLLLCRQPLGPNLAVGQVGRRQREIADEPGLRDEQMELVAEDRLLLRAAVPEAGPGGLPIGGGVGHVGELHDWDGQAVDDALRILGDVEHVDDGLADQMDRWRQDAPAAVEARALGLAREQVAVLVPATEQDRFLVPAAACADDGHGDQLGVRTERGRAWAHQHRVERRAQVADQHVHPRAHVLEITNHRKHLGWHWG
jgi:hypothetical protein